MSALQKPDAKSSIEAAQEAIAKVNAMLIAKGKLKPSQLGSSGTKKAGTQSNWITKEVEINDVPVGCRNMLTRGSTQDEISKMSGAAVATRGRFLTPEERARNRNERALYLSVQATSLEAVEGAVQRINEIIANGIARQGPRMSRFSPAGVLRGPNPPGPRPQQPPQPLLGMNPPTQSITLLQEKLVIGLEHAPPIFSVKDKIFGPGGSFLQHIQSETGAKVTLRGKGSGFIEATGGEALEPMHVHLQHVSVQGLVQAKELATNLIQTVQQEYAAFQQSFVTIPQPPSSMVPQPSMLVPPPQVVSLAQPPPLLPGQQIISTMPPPLQMIPPPPHSAYMQPPPQGSMTVSLTAPGVVIPQLSTSMPNSQPQHGQYIQSVHTYMPPSNTGQPGQIIQSPDHQIIGGPQIVGSQPHLFVSAAQVPHSGQVVFTMAGQPLQHSITQLSPQLGPPGTVMIQQPQQLSQPPPQLSLQPQTVLQQVGILPQHQTAIHQHQIQLPQHQQPNIQQGFLSQPQTMVSTPHYIQQPLLQTSMQQAPLPAGHPAPIAHQAISSWGNPIQPYATLQSMAAPIQSQQVIYSMVQQPSQTPEITFSSPQCQPAVIMTTSSAIPATLNATGAYVYKPGPMEEPKRKFTEEKDDKVPEGLLGYEHGPPHLTNLMVQSSQQQQLASPLQQSQLAQHVAEPGHQQFQQPQPAMYGGQAPAVPQYLYSSLIPQQPQAIAMSQPPSQQYGVTGQPHVAVQPQQQYYQQQIPQPLHQQQPLPQMQLQQLMQHVPGTEQQRQDDSLQRSSTSSSPGPLQGFQQGVASEDKKLMPPPQPPSATGIKRQPSPGLAQLSGPEPRKKAKGLQDTVEDETDIPLSISNQLKEIKKYSYNQYSGTAQLYSTQQGSSYSQYGGSPAGSQQTSSNTEYNAYQQDQNAGYLQPRSQPTSSSTDYNAYQPDQNAGFLQPRIQQTNSNTEYNAYQPDQNAGYLQPLSQFQNSQEGQKSIPVYTGSNNTQTSSNGQGIAGQTYTVYSSIPNQTYPPNISQQPNYSTPPPPPPPPNFEGMDNSTKAIQGYSNKYNVYGLREDNVIHQSPPPPPPPRSYW